jgi:hypothetical protein
MPIVTKWLAAPLVTPLIVLAMACGGGGSEEEEVTRTANEVLLTYFDVMTGKKNGQDLLNVYAPECRSGVNPADIDEVFSLVAMFAPEMSKIDIEAVDMGKLEITKNGDEISVIPAEPDKIRVKVDGKFVNADEYFNSLSGTSTSPGGATMTSTMASVPDDTALTLVRQDGKLYVATCEELQDFSNF